ncbi:hypothetical protein [uncultured Duncaniella sp.]|uniref:hypothetical protein n=1 Tax=uncultured Duncaniella sp. TaxID=2768039 RepID=UPI0025AA08D8|nr:hypothetical protein [uncultured Duncaniella sp.]
MPELREIPDFVADEEHIARVVFSPSMVVDGKLAPTAFKLRMLGSGPETYVSVWRQDFMIPTKENTKDINIPEENILFGYASINVGECRSIKLGGVTVDVKSYPNKKHPYHAGICFSKFSERIKGLCQDPEFIGATKVLANRSVLIAI